MNRWRHILLVGRVFICGSEGRASARPSLNRGHAEAWPSQLRPTPANGPAVRPHLTLLLVALALGWGVVAEARTGAARPPELDLRVRESTYAPVKERDPFSKPGLGVVTVTANSSTNDTPVPVPRMPVIPANIFRLQGILFDASNPSAIVNNELILLNKNVTLKTAAGQLLVKAVEITRDRVVLAVNGQKVELHLSADGGAAPSPKGRKE